MHDLKAGDLVRVNYTLPCDDREIGLSHQIWSERLNSPTHGSLGLFIKRTYDAKSEGLLDCYVVLIEGAERMVPTSLLERFETNET